MVSKDTLEKIMVVMRHHLRPSQVRAIIAELNEVPGNKSFRDTAWNQRRGWIASRFEQLVCSFLGEPGS